MATVSRGGGNINNTAATELPSTISNARPTGGITTLQILGLEKGYEKNQFEQIDHQCNLQLIWEW